VDTIEGLLEALASAARNDRKAEFDRLERELLTRFDGSFDAMPPEIYQQYLTIDRLWPVVATSPEGFPVGGDSAGPRRNPLHVSVTPQEEAWLRQLGVSADRSPSAVLSACLSVIREDDELQAAVARRLARPERSD
jgi:hypothetical protein